MEVPRVVDRPELFGRDELLQAREGRDALVVALLSGRTAGGGVAQFPILIHERNSHAIHFRLDHNRDFFIG